MLYEPRPERTPPTTEKESEEKPLVVVLPGITTNYRNIRSLAGELARYGDVEGKVWNSILSADRPEPGRFRAMAESIGSALKDGRKVVLVGWSLGGSEIIQALLTLRQQEKRYAELNFSKLELVLVSPNGVFEGISGAVRFVQEDLPRLLATMEADSPYQKLDSLITFPPEGIDPKQLGPALREIYPGLSQLTGHEDTVGQVPQTTERDYFNRLKPEDRQAVQSIDQHLATLLQVDPPAPEQWNALRELLEKRGSILQPYQQELYAGDYYPEPEPERLTFRTDLFATALLGFLPSLKIMMLGKYPEFIKGLSDRGATVRFLVPEFDAFVPIDRILAIFPESEVTVIERSTHTAVFPPQPATALAEAMKNLNVQKSSTEPS